LQAPPTKAEALGETESFDFGSCVALHRYLYDHWDHVRQKLISEGRKASVQSPSDIKGRLPVLESLRSLVSNLGPPPMDISWNRPLISANSPPLYSRFQHFMLRNAGRSMESLVTSRAVYDGGESKDGLPMICIILRNIDTEETDYDLLLYCYLRIASRMWHRPFGILIDATCYNGQNEPQDGLFRKLDLLTPSELSKQLSRIYVYNMNSVFRKCFRRILRLSSKSDSSAFHPKNVEYQLIGNLQDLQTHFHLSQLQLPKETISVVADTVYVFQPITRLSRTKGDIEVTIKVGNQFVQVTTTQKQEVVPGLRLSATVNDIFRLGDIEEATTSLQTDDESAFGIRTQNGKIVMYFTSSRKGDVLQAIRAAKIKHGKDLKTPKSFERHVKPQDVPGTLLNIAFTNMASSNSNLRLSAYELLCALCRAFKFADDTQFMSTKELSIPQHPARFITDVSAQLAKSEPQLTVDFLNEFFVGWDSFPWQQRPLSLAYMAPWLPCLRSHVLATETDSEKAREKISTIFRKLIDVALSDLSLSTTFEDKIWPVICQDEIHTEILLEEIVRAARSNNGDESRIETLGSITASFRTVTIRGKLLSKLRKALNRSSLRPTKLISENAVWAEICVLVRLCLSTSFGSGVQSQLYLPELFHIVTMLANSGTQEARSNIHRLLVNTVHAICTVFPLEESRLLRLSSVLTTLSEPRSELFFGVSNSSRDGASISLSQETGSATLAATEAIAILLSEVSIVAAPTVDMSNAWRSRWMSLVASTAFQSNPAIQPRAFTVMGCLAREDVDDDLLYQVLVALRNSIGRFLDENDSEMLVAIVTSLTKMMDKLPTASRYGLQLFWLAVSLVRLVPLALFNCTALFLEAVLNNISTSGDFSNAKMVSVLLSGRTPLREVALELDEIYGIHFSHDHFHLAVCACLVKGLTENVTKATALRVLSTFLETATLSASEEYRFPDNISLLPYLALIMARATSSDEAKEILWLAGTTPSNSCSPDDLLNMIDLAVIGDKELLLYAAISIVDFRYLEDTVQYRCLLWLNKVAVRRPGVLVHLYDYFFLTSLRKWLMVYIGMVQLQAFWMTFCSPAKQHQLLSPPTNFCNLLCPTKRL
jgi:neurofibromin 1